MAWTLGTDFHGFNYAGAHYEIVRAEISRASKTVQVDVLIFPSTASAGGDFNANCLTLKTLTLPFSVLSPELGALKNKIESVILAQFPGATAVPDAG